jgi:hypothetical protein
MATASPSAYVYLHNFHEGRWCSTNSTEHPNVVSAVSEGFCPACELPLAPCRRCPDWLRCGDPNDLFSQHYGFKSARVGCGMHFQICAAHDAT